MKHATIKRKPSRKRPSTASARKAASAGRRKAVVFTSLLGVLAATTVLLKAMAPLPMRPDAADTLFAYNTSDQLNAIFQMQTAVQPDRWHYIYLHQSKTPSGSALAFDQRPEGVTDHFIIGNGDGLTDGELQISQRWNHQQPAASPSNTIKLDNDCISICIVGDLDRTPPTPMQLARLGQLVQALQLHCRIPASHIEWVNDAGSRQAGIGKLFPASVFHEQLRSWPAGSQ